MSRRAMLIPIAVSLLFLSCSFFSASGVANTTPIESTSNAGAVNPANPNTKQAPDSSTSDAKPIRARVGEVVTDRTIRILVHGWNIVTPSKNILPKTGNKLINVEFSIVNIGEEGFYPSNGEWRLLDSNSQAFHPSHEIAQNSGAIFRGERFHASYIYEVPENSSGFELDFGKWIDGKFLTNPILFSFQEVLVDLGSEPTMGDPSIEIPGEVKPKVESIGSDVQCGSWMMRVHRVKDQKPSEFMPILPEGVLHMVLGEITMTNRSADTLSLDYTDFWMQDPTGLRFGSYPGQVADMSSDGPPDFESGGVDGTYAPAEQKIGKVGFGIPINSGPMWLVFWCGGQSSPAQVEKVYVNVPTLEE